MKTDTSMPIDGTAKYRLSFTYRFEAAHRFTQSCAETCATPHGHTWRAKAVFEADESILGPDDMVLEFSRLKSAWKAFLQDTVDHSFMHHFEDPILPALKQHVPKFRGLPFPGDPTTELIAALFLAKLEAMTASLKKGLRPVAVVIRETPTNTISLRASDRGGSRLVASLDQTYKGWWRSADPAARFIARK